MAKALFCSALGVCCVVAGWMAATAAQAGVVTFGDLSLPAESYWSGPDPLGTNVQGSWGSTVRVGSFASGGAEFNNNYNLDWGSWSGFAYSNTTDTVTPGYGNQSSSYAGGGLSDANYAMGFGYSEVVPSTAAELEGLPTITLPAAAQILGTYVSNATYAALSMLTGDSFAKKFGGTSGNDADWLKLTAYGVDASGNLLSNTAEFYLADYRSSDNALDMSGNVWEWTRTWYDEDKKYRVVRGGSWIGYQWFARSSFCNWSIPLMFNDDLGFRVVIAPKDS